MQVVRRIALVGAVVTGLGAALLAPGASAFWAGVGSGSAHQRLIPTHRLVLEPVIASRQLRPGSSGGLAIRVENPNPFQVTLRSLELDTAAGTDGFDVDLAHAGCDVSALSFAGADNDGAGWAIPPSVGSDVGARTIHVTDAIAMSSTAADACQGAEFDVHLRAAR